MKVLRIAMKVAGLTVCMILTTHVLLAQIPDSVSSVIQSVNRISDKGLKLLNNRYALLEKSLEKQTNKALLRMQRKESELQKKMHGANSVKYRKFYNDAIAHYQKLKQQLASPGSFAGGGIAQRVRSYVPNLDTMSTAVKYLTQKGFNFSDSRLQQLSTLSARLQTLQSKMQCAGQVQAFLQEREQLLKNEFSNLGITKQLVGLNKEAYYYQQRFNQYKTMLNDRDKLKQNLLTAVAQQPTFQKFYHKNSFLASMFPMPLSASGDTALASLGLQTRNQVGNAIQQKLGKSSGTSTVPSDGGVSYLQQQVQKGRSELDVLKNKVSQYMHGTSTMVMPDFKPNAQKTKTFLKRLQYGLNIQNAPATALLPAMSDLAFTLGYKMNDRSTAGVGVAYKLGWGTPIKNIQLSNQGIGLRSFLEVKAKGNFWATCGLEYNYMQAFAGIADVRNINLWQKSALVGIAKKYKVGSKMANIQLLYDLLAHEQMPSAQALKFRVGYNF